MKRSALIFLLIFLQYSIANSQNEAHRIVKSRMESKNIPGMAFLIAKDGKILDQGYYGKANLEVDADVSEKSVFAIASMSKTYIAATILFMAEQGILSLDDSVKKYITEAPDTWEPITIKHLLTHSSGLVDDWKLYDWNPSDDLLLKTQTDADFLKVHFDQELKFKPGTDASYSSGPFVLGVVIERITGQYYGDYMHENLLEPLSLSETYIDDPVEIIPHRVSGYLNYDPEIMKTRVSGLGNGYLMAPRAYGRADVGIRTTANDLLKFYSSLFSSEFLNENSKNLMFEPTRLDNGEVVSYGAGWMNWPIGGLLISEHGGLFGTGFSSQAFVVPKDKFVVIILTNLHRAASFSMAKELAALYYPELEKLSKKVPGKDTNPNLTKNHLAFLQSINSNKQNINSHGNFPFSYYPNYLKKMMSETQSITYLGEKILENEKVNFFEVDILTLRYYRLNGKQTLYTTVYLDKDNNLAFIDYPETE